MLTQLFLMYKFQDVSEAGDVIHLNKHKFLKRLKTNLNIKHNFLNQILLFQIYKLFIISNIFRI